LGPLVRDLNQEVQAPRGAQRPCLILCLLCVRQLLCVNLLASNAVPVTGTQWVCCLWRRGWNGLTTHCNCSIGLNDLEGFRALFWHHVKLAFIGLFAIVRACGSYCECGGTNASRGESQRITVTFTDDGNNVHAVLSTGAVKAELLVNALFDCSLSDTTITSW
jgi:hypothetical protein